MLKYNYELYLNFTKNSMNENIEKSLITIGKSCEQLKKFTIFGNSSVIHFNKSVFEVFKEFRELRKLDIFLFDINWAKNGSIASFKNLKNLRQLELNINDLNDSHLKIFTYFYRI